MTISFIIYHYFNMSKEELMRDAATYYYQKFLSKNTEIEIIVMLEKMNAEDFKEIKNSLKGIDKSIKILETDRDFAGPGSLWNQGYQKSTGDFVVFTWTGVRWHSDSLLKLINMIKKEQLDAVYGMAKYTTLDNSTSHIQTVSGIKELSENYLSLSNSVPLCYTLITRNIVETLGGFVKDKELSRIADWEFIIRLTTKFKTSALIAMPISIECAISNINYQYCFRYSLDELIRIYISKTNYSPCKLQWPVPKKIVNIDKSYKIAIVGVLTENAQVQLCFLNYFEAMGEQKFLTWRRFEESQIRSKELEGYDIVFFVRCSSLNAFRAAEYCHEKKIKTVYVLDDNWFYITETYPYLEKHMGKNTSHNYYSTMLIRLADYVLVYNDLLAEDIKKYNPAVLRLKPNVTMDHFQKEHTIAQKDSLSIGFAGSTVKLQHFEPAFKALVKILSDFQEVNLYFKGIELPLLFCPFNDRITQTAYTLDYKKYAREVSSWQCDIMISPLDATRYTNSKCPNKYLEITASGAAGIYSNTQLYQAFILNHYNGIIINNQEEEWYKAIKLLIEDQSLRSTIINNAKQDIRQKYDTKVLLPDFVKMLEIVLHKT